MLLGSSQDRFGQWDSRRPGRRHSLIHNAQAERTLYAPAGKAMLGMRAPDQESRGG